MPCYTIQTVSVNLGKVDLDLLEKAINALYPNFKAYRSGKLIQFYGGQSYNQETNVLQVRDQSTVATIKRAYSAEVVKSQAKRFGWQLKETAPFQFEVVKR